MYSPLTNQLRCGTVRHAGTKMPPELGRPRPPGSITPRCNATPALEAL
jgi:hypothetical protein